MQNLFFHDLVAPQRRLDVFRTTAVTAGLNYFIKGHYAKIQVNYNWAAEEAPAIAGTRDVRNVRNDNLLVNFQVSW
jgi:hypothetical protein